MEFKLSFPSTVITAFVPIVALIVLFQFLNQKARKQAQKKPAPRVKGARFILGHLHLLRGSEPPYKVLSDLADEYGPIFTIKFGVRQALVVSDRQMASECFTTNDKAFASRPKGLAIETMSYNYGMFGFSPYGEYWRQVRKMVTVELLSQRRVELLQYVRVPEVRESMKEIFEAWVKNEEHAVAVDMKKWIERLILNMIVRMISGKRFSSDDAEGARFKSAVNKFMGLLGTFFVSDLVPYLRRFDIGKRLEPMKVAAAEMDDIFEEWLQEHKREKISGRQQSNGPQVFMDALISILEESKQEFPGFDHHTVIKSTCLAMLIAGSDTSSVTLTWALSLLMNHPEALKAVQDEIDLHVGRERLVEESDIKKLPYLRAIVKETLRLYPVVPLSGPRESIQDCFVGGYFIPKGTRLMTHIWKIQHDPKIWPHPNQFRPERFLTTSKDIDVKGQNFELIPFGSGRRMCPGVTLALHSIHMTLASVIQGFELEKPSNEPISMTEKVGVTIMRNDPLEILLKPRLSTGMYHFGA